MYIRLEAFEGPFELLFHLIEKNEIDIYDIPMTVLTQQYLDAIRGLPPDMEGMSEFLVMAATLLEIKSRMLLPRPQQPDEEGEDPRDALVRRLVAYRQAQGLAETLKSYEDAGKRLFRQPEASFAPPARRPREWLLSVSLDSIMEAFDEAMRRQELRVDRVHHRFGEVPRDRFTVEQKIASLSIRLRNRETLRLSLLFDECETRSECVVVFLALLEMMWLGLCRARQSASFAEVEIYKD
jgi:segregation and condensation protein A